MTKAKQDKKEVATTQPDGGAVATYDYGEHGNAGFAGTEDEMMIPFLNLLQKGSPEVDSDDPKVIEGASAGMLLNSVTKELYDNVLITPVHWYRKFVEWVPRDAGGGYVGEYDEDHEIVKKALAASSGKRYGLKTESDNDLIETVYLYVLTLDSEDATESVCPAVIAFTVTKLKVWRQIITNLRMVKGGPPLYAFRINVGSVGEINNQKQPYKNLTMTPINGSARASLIPPQGPSSGLLEEGKLLAMAVTSGEAKPDVNSVSGDVGHGDDEETPF